MTDFIWATPELQFLFINKHGGMTTEDLLGITYNTREGLGSPMSNTDPQGLFLSQRER